MRCHLPVGLIGCLWLLCSAAWAEPDWASMDVTTHGAYQAVNADGQGTFPTVSAVRMRGLILNAPADMLDTTPGSDPFMGGQWQLFVQATGQGDFGGTALYMGQNIGKITGNHPAGSYSDQEWLAELDRLNHDPASGRAFRPGDLVEVRARAPGLFFRGKTNINEQHQKTPLADFDIVLLEPARGPLSPVLLTLSDVKDATDQFIFDATRGSGAERYQGSLVRFENVSFSAGNWGPGQAMHITDGNGRSLPVILGLGSGFSLYSAPAAPFDIVGVFDQEDADGSDGYRGGYRLWVMDYDGEAFVPYRHVKPDFDKDGDVDPDDLDRFQNCASGPMIPQMQTDCAVADFDVDGDVDQEDFGVLQRCLSGSDGLADSDCDR